jgi:hypothetical protein
MRIVIALEEDTMKFNTSLTALFASAVMLAGCGPSPKEVAQQEQEHKQVLEKLEAGDAITLRKAGFEIVARTGAGSCNRDGGMGNPDYWGSSTDLSYVLKKPGSDATYTACMKHGGGEGNLTGLRALERLAPAPK